MVDVSRDQTILSIISMRRIGIDTEHPVPRDRPSNHTRRVAPDIGRPMDIPSISFPLPPLPSLFLVHADTRAPSSCTTKISPNGRTQSTAEPSGGTRNLDDRPGFRVFSIQVAPRSSRDSASRCRTPPKLVSRGSRSTVSVPFTIGRSPCIGDRSERVPRSGATLPGVASHERGLEGARTEQ